MGVRAERPLPGLISTGILYATLLLCSSPTVRNTLYEAGAKFTLLVAGLGASIKLVSAPYSLSTLKANDLMLLYYLSSFADLLLFVVYFSLALVVFITVLRDSRGSVDHGAEIL